MRGMAGRLVVRYWLLDADACDWPIHRASSIEYPAS
jgi:hypothetical protein